MLSVRFGPGSLQLLQMLQYSIERGLKVFDFTIGDEPYKREWSDIEMRLYDHVSFATPRGAMGASTRARYAWSCSTRPTASCPS